jgi:hypothetical protein
VIVTDWVHLSDADFSVVCDELGTAIHCPLKWGFRRRLRFKTAPPQPVLHSLPLSQPVASTGSPSESVLTAAQPRTQPVGSILSMREHDVVTPAVTPHGSSYAEPHSSEKPPAYTAADTAHSESTAETMHMAATGEVPGETCASTS